MNHYYAGIGSRETPPAILNIMFEMARALAGRDYILRSGHADGADDAFERGAAGKAQIFLPWNGFNHANGHNPVQGERFDAPSDRAFEIAREHHPRWTLLSNAAMKFHARNSHQVLGLHLDEPASYVICWTPNGTVTGHDRDSGGTGQALRIADYFDIPVYNLYHKEHLDWAVQAIEVFKRIPPYDEFVNTL